MKTPRINEGFVCAVCATVVPPAQGTCRDHCVQCLASLHVDDQVPGDRASGCQGIFEPVSAMLHQKKGIMIHYRCAKCGGKHQNRAAEDDNQETITSLILETNRRTAGL